MVKGIIKFPQFPWGRPESSFPLSGEEWQDDSVLSAEVASGFTSRTQSLPERFLEEVGNRGEILEQFATEWHDVIAATCASQYPSLWEQAAKSERSIAQRELAWYAHRLGSDVLRVLKELSEEHYELLMLSAPMLHFRYGDIIPFAPERSRLETYFLTIEHLLQRVARRSASAEELLDCITYIKSPARDILESAWLIEFEAEAPGRPKRSFGELLRRSLFAQFHLRDDQVLPLSSEKGTVEPAFREAHVEALMMTLVVASSECFMKALRQYLTAALVPRYSFLTREMFEDFEGPYEFPMYQLPADAGAEGAAAAQARLFELGERLENAVYDEQRCAELGFGLRQQAREMPWTAAAAEEIALRAEDERLEAVSRKGYLLSLLSLERRKALEEFGSLASDSPSVIAFEQSAQQYAQYAHCSLGAERAQILIDRALAPVMEIEAALRPQLDLLNASAIEVLTSEYRYQTSVRLSPKGEECVRQIVETACTLLRQQWHIVSRDEYSLDERCFLFLAIHELLASRIAVSIEARMQQVEGLEKVYSEVALQSFFRLLNERSREVSYMLFLRRPSVLFAANCRAALRATRDPSSEYYRGLAEGFVAGVEALAAEDRDSGELFALMLRMAADLAVAPYQDLYRARKIPLNAWVNERFVLSLEQAFFFNAKTRRILLEVDIQMANEQYYGTARELGVFVRNLVFALKEKDFERWMQLYHAVLQYQAQALRRDQDELLRPGVVRSTSPAELDSLERYASLLLELEWFSGKH